VRPIGKNRKEQCSASPGLDRVARDESLDLLCPDGALLEIGTELCLSGREGIGIFCTDVFATAVSATGFNLELQHAFSFIMRSMKSVENELLIRAAHCRVLSRQSTPFSFPAVSCQNS